MAADNDIARLVLLAQEARAAIPESTRDAMRRAIETARKHGPDPAQMLALKKTGAGLRQQLEQIENSPGLRRVIEDMTRFQQGELPAADQPAASSPPNKIRANAIAGRGRGQPSKKEKILNEAWRIRAEEEWPKDKNDLAKKVSENIGCGFSTAKAHTSPLWDELIKPDIKPDIRKPDIKKPDKV